VARFLATVGAKKMSAKTISHCQGKGSITHNNREFVFKNVDPSRTAENITYAKQPLDEAYRECFGEALQRFNDKQTRTDRRIDDYYSHLFGNAPKNTVAVGANKQKSFYETLVQVGTKDDSGVGSPDGALAAKCLDEYMRGFSERNPNFHVFNAVLHKDEATPHLHIDYIPVGHFKRGMDTQNGIAQALKEMGHGSGKDAINRWRLSERKALEGICREYGVEIAEPQTARGHSFTPDEYKEYKDELAELQDKIGFHEEIHENLTNSVQELSDELQGKGEELAELETVKEQTQAKISELRTNAVQAHREVETAQGVLNDLERKRKGLEGEILALETKRETLTAKELAELKGTKTLTGGVKGVNFKEYQALKETAAHNHELVNLYNHATQETAKAQGLAAATNKVNQAILGFLQNHFPDTLKQVVAHLDSLRKKQRGETVPPQPRALSLEEVQKEARALRAAQTPSSPATVRTKKDFTR
jgi:hypothetical protein